MGGGAGLLDWVESPVAGDGIRFARDDGGWELVDYPRLAGLSMGVASRLADLGVGRDDVVCLAYDTGPRFVAAFFGTLLAGATPSPLAPPSAFQRTDEYVTGIAALLEAAAPALVICDAPFQPLMGEAAARAGVARAPVVLDEGADGAFSSRPAAELALLQFTSGSSGTPRGVRVTRANLEANIHAIRTWLGMGPADVTATWLPMHHDMGLIGCMLTPVVNRSPVLVLSPGQFVQAPERWVDCFGSQGAALTAGPSFGFAYVASRLREHDGAGWDLSGWRVAIVGAERVDAQALDRFATLLEPHGFRRSAFRPAYGLAEATLAVSAHDGSRAPSLARVEWDRLRVGEPAPVLDVTELGEAEIERSTDWLVGCGRPLTGAAVSVVDDEGHPVPDGVVGEIVASGTSVADGYRAATRASASRTHFEGEAVRTGDCGFVAGGELWVVGRMGDSLKVRGRSIFAEDLEAKLVEIPGVRPGRVVALLGTHEGREVAAAVAEGAPPEAAEALQRVLRREAGAGARIVGVVGERGTIARTTSGKPRRRVMWERLKDGSIGGETVFDSAREEARAVAGA
jgi:acyl-CoA synthetase (AMP-forming)/AMP-acid ligase II